jgi:uncharacterized membrane protein
VTNIGNLPNAEAAAQGVAINNSGEIAGDSNGNAFLYSNGVMTAIDPGVESFAFAINASGQVAGFTGGANPAGFIYSGGTLSAFSGQGLAINGAGVVAGDGTEAGVFGFGVAALFQGGVTTFVPPSVELPGGYANAFTGINDAGQIVGFADGDAFLYSAGQFTLLGNSCPYPLSTPAAR